MRRWRWFLLAALLPVLAYVVLIAEAHWRPKLILYGEMQTYSSQVVVAVDVRNTGFRPIILERAELGGIPETQTSSWVSLAPSCQPCKEDRHAVRFELPLDTPPGQYDLVIHYRYLGWPFKVRRKTRLSEPPPAAQAANPLPCTGEYYDDLRLLEAPSADEVLRCAAEVAPHNAEYRAAVTSWLLEHREAYTGTDQPGHQAFIRTTQLSFGDAKSVAVPDGWSLRDALPSPDGRYVAAHLTDGTVGWWELESGRHGTGKAAGRDLVWHPVIGEFAYISGENEIHLVRVGQTTTHDVLKAPDASGLRYPYWAVQNGPGKLYGRDAAMVLSIADPKGVPQGVVYLPVSRTWERFDANMTPQSWEQLTIPPWIAQPWSPHSGYLVTFSSAGQALIHPSAGTPDLLYPVPARAEVRSLTWSPGGTVLAVLERQESGLVARVLRSFQSNDGPALSIPLVTEQFALSDDGATTFTVSGATVAATNHLTGEETAWSPGGEILGVRLSRSILLIVQADRVIVVRYRQGTD